MAKFYITSSLPYTNASPHIGFALEIIETDVLARWHRQKGEDVFFLTGTDEHGTKIAKTAKEAGVSPQEFVDSTAAKFQELTKALHISNNDFIRTSDQQRHWPAVKSVWEKLEANSDLYKKQYEGLYCSGCEAFITEKELIDGKCAIHKKEPEKVQEENWFFKLSKYAPELERILRENTIRIVPEHKKNELLQLIAEGLEDVSFSRPKEKLAWGIPVPGDELQVVYVWGDALTNYISALGYPSGENFKKYWPADIHVVGKDIVRFHALIWPAMLLSLSIELPKAIFVHGFITVDGQKMSKSLGNVVDPFELVEKYGTDAVRYFFLREIPPTEDGDFNYEKFETRYNADLANGLGNLVARTLALAKDTQASPTPDFEKLWQNSKPIVEDSLRLDFNFRGALDAIWDIIHYCDEYIDREKPWEDKENSREVMRNLLFAIHLIAELLQPFLPETAEKIQKQLQGRKSEVLFPRIQ